MAFVGTRDAVGFRKRGECCGVRVCQLAVFLQTYTGGGVFLRADVWRGNVRAVSTKDENMDTRDSLRMGWCSLGSCNS